MEDYQALSKRQQDEWEDFPIFWAFNQEQFAEGMKKLALLPSDTDQVYPCAGGGYYRKADSQRLRNLIKRHDHELTEALKDESFAYSAFRYELENHEFVVSWRIEDTLRSLGLDSEEVEENQVLSRALQTAIADIQEAWHAQNQSDDDEEEVTLDLFSLGVVVETPGAKESIDQEKKAEALGRHRQGDWGDMCDEDKQSNARALVDGTRLLSCYSSADGLMFWIITEADRSVTTILLPEEY